MALMGHPRLTEAGMAHGYLASGVGRSEVVASVAAEARSAGQLAWSDLIAALTLLARGKTEEVSPCYCQHDVLTVLSDPDVFSGDELDQLAAWGFHPDGVGGFYSFRFGGS